MNIAYLCIIPLLAGAYALRASKNRQVAEYGFELSTGRKNRHAPHAAE